MKRVIIFLLFVLAGCANPGINPFLTYEAPKTLKIYKYDFRQYNSKGFLITPSTYYGDYESIGMLDITLFPPIVRSGANYQGAPQWKVEYLNTQEVIDSLYTKAVEYGADGIMNFTVSFETQNNGILEIVGTRVSGYAIKRIKK